jgi:excisionase family DNA binding protein
MSTAFSSTQPLLSVSDIATALSVGRQTVRRWIATRQLRSLRIGGSVRVRAEDLTAFVHVNREREQVSA